MNHQEELAFTDDELRGARLAVGAAMEGRHPDLEGVTVPAVVAVAAALAAQAADERGCHDAEGDGTSAVLTSIGLIEARIRDDIQAQGELLRADRAHLIWACSWLAALVARLLAGEEGPDRALAQLRVLRGRALAESSDR